MKLTTRVHAALAIGLAAALATAAVEPLGAQSITSTRGFGYPIVPTDARADVLGGLGIGLKGLTVPMIDPSSPAGVVRRGAIVSVASVNQDVAVGDASAEHNAARFPLIRVLYPAGGLVFSAGYGGYLDQSWAITREGEQVESGVPLSYRDDLVSEGGIGQFQVGAAAPVGRGVAVGAAVGLYTGNRRITFRRNFLESDVGSLQPFDETRTVEYFAPLAQLGARWDPNDVVRMAASLTWGGTLDADSVEGRATDAEYDMPLQAAAGASAYLGPSILATASGRWTGWSTIGTLQEATFGAPFTSTARDTWEVGGGLEWDNPAAREQRNYALRLGGQYRQLPFTFGADAPTEWFVGVGAGMRLGADIENPVARLDLTVQRGERTAAGNDDTPDVTESAWRFALSLSIFGN